MAAGSNCVRHPGPYDYPQNQRSNCSLNNHIRLLRYLLGFFIGWLLLPLPSYAQPITAASIYAKQTLYAERLKRRDGLYKYTILPLLRQSPDSTNEFQFLSALWSISQYMLRNDTTRQLVDTLFQHYDSLDNGTRRSLMEVVYALYPTEYQQQVQQHWPQETDDRLLAMMVFYQRGNKARGWDEKTLVKKLMADKAHYDSSALLQQVMKTFLPTEKTAIPSLTDLFRYQTALGCKVVYSLQRPNRNYSGLAIIQNSDGHFARDSATGRLKTFVQLARSAADLPYFITNGSTPQGIYRVRGTGISQNGAIGPTPNLQLNLPYEVAADSFFIHSLQPMLNDSIFLAAYQQLLPASWQTDAMLESFNAGKCGRGAIIAHGTTLDPWYYQGMPFYPCTPTLGCLCAREVWNPGTGRLVQSDQLDMVNTFLSTPGTDGYLFVINLADKKSAVTPEEVAAIVNVFENVRK
jgi:hypothetical protein